MKKLVFCTAGVAMLALPQQATSRITLNTVEPVAALSEQGRRVEVGVLLGCDRAQKARLRVSVNQDSGAYAERKRRVNCVTTKERFAVVAELRRHTRLEAGDATACVLALTRDNARQWCKEITLE